MLLDEIALEARRNGDSRKLSLRLLPGEYWWGGACDKGVDMPWSDCPYALDLAGDNFSNQTAPLLVSNRGRYLWSEEPFAFEFSGDQLRATGRGPLLTGVASEPTLRGAYRTAAGKFFPATGKLPDPLLFTAPQYCTWIEFLYEQSQERVLDYARAVLHHGFPAGVMIIDCGWQRYYGDWHFTADRFPDPAGMVRKLHELGFKVMLWMAPFVSPDSVVYRHLRDAKGLLVEASTGKPVVREWWDGHSAIVDLSGGYGLAWFRDQLRRLQRDFAVDGFKFDAGDTMYYRDSDRGEKPLSTNGHTESYARVGLDYTLNEYRACWKMGGTHLVQRLRDKFHSWEDNGLASLIPNSLAQGLLGLPFNCADMIGGGEYLNFTANSHRLDPELVVRYAQASALLPMMQFSAAPWRILDSEHLACCLGATAVRQRFVGLILELARHAAATGEPIARHMAYVFPDAGFDSCRDQFMLGDNIVVAPILTPRAVQRTVLLPLGHWRADDGMLYSGPAEVVVATPLNRLPYFERVIG